MCWCFKSYTFGENAQLLILQSNNLFPFCILHGINWIWTFCWHLLPNLNVCRRLCNNIEMPKHLPSYFPAQNHTHSIRFCYFVPQIDTALQKLWLRQGGGRFSGLYSKSFAVVLWCRTGPRCHFKWILDYCSVRKLYLSHSCFRSTGNFMLGVAQWVYFSLWVLVGKL